MNKEWSGVVTLGDDYRCADSGEKDGAVWIGDVDVVKSIHEGGFKGDITVGIADERWKGPLSGDLGWGYSEYTPMDSDSLSVGGHDLIAILRRHEGKTITLFVRDEEA